MISNRKNIYKIFSPRVIFLLFIIGSETQPLNFSGQPTCYKSFGSPEFPLTLYHVAPSGPQYMQAIIEYQITPSDSSFSAIYDITTHHLFKQESSCSGSFQFSNKNVAFSKWTIDVYLYLGFRNELLAEFHTDIQSGFNYKLNHLRDISNQWVVAATFSRNGAEYAQLSSGISHLAMTLLIMSLRPINRNLCLMTAKNEYLVVRPIYSSSVPTELISEVEFRFTINGKVVERVIMPAYGCGESDSELIGDFIFIDEQPRSADLNIVARHLLGNQLTQEYIYVNVPEDIFTLPDAEYLSTNDPGQSIQSGLPYFFLFQGKMSFKICSYTRGMSIHYSSTGVMVFKYDITYERYPSRANWIKASYGLATQTEC